MEILQGRHRTLHVASLRRNPLLMRWKLAAVSIAMFANISPLVAQAPTSAPGPDSAYFRGDYAAALAGYSDLVKHDTANAVAWFRIGVSQHQLGRYREALPALLKGQRLGFQAFSAQLRIARTYARLGNRSAALAYLDSVAAGAATYGLAPSLLSGEADFESLKSEARFVDALARGTAARYPCPGGASTTQFDFWI